MVAAALPDRCRHMTSLSADYLPSLISGLGRHEQRHLSPQQGTRNHSHDKFSSLLFQIALGPPINLMITLFNLLASYHRTVKVRWLVLTGLTQTGDTSNEMEAPR